MIQGLNKFKGLYEWRIDQSNKNLKVVCHFIKSNEFTHCFHFLNFNGFCFVDSSCFFQHFIKNQSFTDIYFLENIKEGLDSGKHWQCFK